MDTTGIWIWIAPFIYSVPTEGEIARLAFFLFVSLFYFYFLFLSFSSCNIFNFHFSLLYLVFLLISLSYSFISLSFLCLSVLFYLSIFFFLISFFLCMWPVTGFCEHGNELRCPIKRGEYHDCLDSFFLFGIATRLAAGPSGVWIPVGPWDFCLIRNVHAASGPFGVLFRA